MLEKHESNKHMTPAAIDVAWFVIFLLSAVAVWWAMKTGGEE
jgi:hypothetical protein